VLIFVCYLQHGVSPWCPELRGSPVHPSTHIVWMTDGQPSQQLRVRERYTATGTATTVVGFEELFVVILRLSLSNVMYVPLIRRVYVIIKGSQAMVPVLCTASLSMRL